MTPERWGQIGELYHAALDMAREQRAAFLDEVCAGDQELRREIESLLAADEKAGDFIAEPALNDAAKMLVEDQSSTLASLAAGRRLGRYRIISLLGTGGMGEVYLAYDPRLGRRVALKLLLAEFTRDEARVRRFVKEARAVSALNHPSIITIHEIGQSEGRHYIVTEFIEGQTLRQRISQSQLSLSAALDIAAQTASALQAAHAAGIVHRDIKPENIMVRPDGLVKVLDFGLAKLTERPALTAEFETKVMTSRFKTEPGMVMGTVAYMSPEQLRGGEVDARSDIFSLGVVCYEITAGRRPFAGATNSHVIVAILEQDPPPLSQHAPESSPEFQRIVGKALHKDRDHRYQRVEDLLADLKSLKQKVETQAEPASDQKAGRRRETVTTGSHPPALPLTTQAGARGAGLGTTTRLMLNAERQLHRLKIHRRGLVIALAMLIIALAAAIFHFSRSPALTEKDTVLLADFVNQTGDEVFDNTLKQALAVHLEQTPFLNFFPEERIRETLRYMGRSPDERVTKDLAREICQRQGVKALVVSSIARFDRRYSITLEAINSQTGETIGSALAEAEDKDRVLRALGQAATQLRERLGESLASIQKFDAPLEQATTSSLDALKAWSRGLVAVRSGGGGAIPLYKHATELDPNFAKAYVSLSLAYSYREQPELAAEYADKAFRLKERVTERERFDIATNYYATGAGDLLKAIESLELWRQTYPRDHSPPSRLAAYYRLVGQFEKSLAAAREANQLNPRAYVPYVAMGTALVQLNRFDEAQAIIEQAIEQQLATATSRRDRYQVALIKGDAARMKQQVDWATGRVDEYWAFHWQAQSSSFAGQLLQAQAFYARAAALVEQRFPEMAAWFAEEALLRSAVCGQCRRVKTVSDPRTLASSRINLQPYIPVTMSRALALALCGEIGQAQAPANEAARSNPQSTLANAIWLPVIRAAIELQRGNPDQAIQLLQPTSAYEQAAMFWPTYLRGRAHLRRKSGAEAAVEFQKILDHRGWDPTSPLYPLAQLGLARATALTGDAARSRQAYQDFLALWKDADPDLPILIEARKEIVRLKLKNRNASAN
jgi:tetratricopeptide (TPR) repeat protein